MKLKVSTFVFLALTLTPLLLCQERFNNFNEMVGIKSKVLPGITSAGTRNEIQDTTTNSPDGK